MRKEFAIVKIKGQTIFKREMIAKQLKYAVCHKKKSYFKEPLHPKMPIFTRKIVPKVKILNLNTEI